MRAEDLAPALGLSEEQAHAEVLALVEGGLVAAAGRGFRLSPDGKARVGSLLDAEYDDVDDAAMVAAYDEFCGFNADLKQIITDWQVTPSGEPNLHDDATYDHAVLTRLVALHDRFVPLLERFGTIAPRLATYPRRFAHACERIAAGEQTWVARPITDSFHTVWFELHEDLIRLCGRTRLEEAAAGRAH
ncbi:hypothetical protein [Nocardioides sambongensis]|uniref:hypothetical protein n=1 Tax=Nocardioides sambongensis TaxID=2589074 RepID=UPI00112C0D0B|nr:hypothetical protein [Nocardioides sambongensis]